MGQLNFAPYDTIGIHIADTSPLIDFPGLEIRLLQRRVLKDRIDISLRRIFTKAQIFKAVWNMEREGCQ